MAVRLERVRGASLGRLIVGAVVATALDAALLMWALGGPAALIAHHRAVALLAAWLVGGMALTVLRPVRVHDPVGAAREPPWTLPVLFVIPLLIPPLSALGERLGVLILPGGMPLRWSGVAISALGLAIRIASMARLGSRFSPLINVQREHGLETRGPYAFVRHPGYLGTLLAALGAVLAFGSGLGLAPWIVLYLVLDRRMRREEAFLEQQFGDEFRSWRARTGRLIPGLWRRVNAKPEANSKPEMRKP